MYSKVCMSSKDDLKTFDLSSHVPRRNVHHFTSTNQHYAINPKYLAFTRGLDWINPLHILHPINNQTQETWAVFRNRQWRNILTKCDNVTHVMWNVPWTRTGHPRRNSGCVVPRIKHTRSNFQQNCETNKVSVLVSIKASAQANKKHDQKKYDLY